MIYKHFKGGFYKRIGAARDCDNSGYIVIVYEALQDNGDFKKGEWWYREVGRFYGEARPCTIRMRKLTLYESLLFVCGMKRFIK